MRVMITSFRLQLNEDALDCFAVQPVLRLPGLAAIRASQGNTMRLGIWRSGGDLRDQLGQRMAWHGSVGLAG